MTTKFEKISVLISVYNGEATISQSLESILNQTYENFEILVLDDGSTDRTSELINNYSKNYSKLKIFKNEKNMGLTYSLNYLITKSTGKYLARQDADDISYQDRFEKQVSTIVENNIDFCTSRAHIKGSKRKIPGVSHFLPYKHLLKFKNPFIHGTLMISRKAMNEIGLYDSRYKFAQDYKLFLDLIQKDYKYMTLKEPLYELNMKNNISTKNKDEQKYFANCVRKGINP